MEVRTESACNSLLWHWVMIISFDRWLWIGCLATALGFAAPPAPPPPSTDTRPRLVAAGLKWRVVNLGVSGNTTMDGLNRLRHVVAQKPRITIVEFGGNDGLRGLPIETTRANLEQIVQTLQGGGSKVLL